MLAQSSKRELLIKIGNSDDVETDIDAIDKEPKWMIAGGSCGQNRVSPMNIASQIRNNNRNLL